MPAPAQGWSKRNIIFVAIAAFPLGLLAEHFAGSGSGLPTSLAALVVTPSVWWRWDLSNKLWFWAAVVAIIALHMMLILHVHWTTRWIPAVISAPFCILDGLLILQVFELGEKLTDSH
jgi:hypothetical protein